MFDMFVAVLAGESFAKEPGGTEGFVPQSIPELMQFVTSVCRVSGSQALKKS
jgi:hypothetical protein